MSSPPKVWLTHLCNPDDQVVWGFRLLLKEVLGAHPNLTEIQTMAESAGTYTALVLERLLAAYWPTIVVRTTMVAIAMPPTQFPRTAGLAGEFPLSVRGERINVIHYMKDKLSIIFDPQALNRFLRDHY